MAPRPQIRAKNVAENPEDGTVATNQGQNVAENPENGTTATNQGRKCGGVGGV